MPGLNLTPGGGVDLSHLEVRLSELEATAGGKFRGEWVADTRMWNDDLAAVAPAAPLWTFGGNSASVIGMSSARGSSKPIYSAAISLRRFGGESSSPNYTEATLDLSQVPALQGKSLTRLQFWDNHYRDFAGFTSNVVKYDGLQVASYSNPNYDTTMPWGKQTVVGGLNASTKVTWRVTSTNVNNPDYHWAIAGIEVFGVADPYMYNDYVIYDAKMWRSELDNNANTPGAGGWGEVPVADLNTLDGRVEALESGLPTYPSGAIPPGAVAPYMVVNPATDPVSLYFEDGV